MDRHHQNRPTACLKFTAQETKRRTLELYKYLKHSGATPEATTPRLFAKWFIRIARAL